MNTDMRRANKVLTTFLKMNRFFSHGWDCCMLVRFSFYRNFVKSHCIHLDILEYRSNMCLHFRISKIFQDFEFLTAQSFHNIHGLQVRYVVFDIIHGEPGRISSSRTWWLVALESFLCDVSFEKKNCRSNKTWWWRLD